MYKEYQEKTTYGLVYHKDGKMYVDCPEYDCKEKLEIDEFLYKYGWNSLLCKKHQEKLQRDFEELSNDTDYVEEIDAWEITIGDGLEDE